MFLNGCILSDRRFMTFSGKVKQVKSENAKKRRRKKSHIYLQGRHGEFEPGKAQYVFYPEFFWPVVSYMSILKPKIQARPRPWGPCQPWRPCITFADNESEYQLAYQMPKAVEDTRYPLMKRCISTLLFTKMNDFPQISIYEVQRSLYNRKLRFLAQWGAIISKVPCIISCPLIFVRFFLSIWQV